MIEISIKLPQNVAQKLSELSAGNDLARQSLEVLVCSLYRQGRLTHFEARTAIGLPSRLAFDELLARLDLQPDDYSWDDFLEDKKVFEPREE
jgi:hypothetical protein